MGDPVSPTTPDSGLETGYTGEILDLRYQEDLLNIQYGLAKYFLESAEDLETVDLNLIPHFVTS